MKASDIYKHISELNKDISDLRDAVARIRGGSLSDADKDNRPSVQVLYAALVAKETELKFFSDKDYVEKPFELGACEHCGAWHNEHLCPQCGQENTD